MLNLEQAERELVLALRVEQDSLERGETRLADWARWWGWRLLGELRGGQDGVGEEASRQEEEEGAEAEERAG